MRDRFKFADLVRVKDMTPDEFDSIKSDSGRITSRGQLSYHWMVHLSNGVDWLVREDRLEPLITDEPEAFPLPKWSET